jgi:hypothetical protein
MPTKKDFRKDLEKILVKYNNSKLAKHIQKCLIEYDNQSKNKSKDVENPYGVELNKIPEKNEEVLPNQPIPAPIGNNTTLGWNNPFGGTSWGV